MWSPKLSSRNDISRCFYMVLLVLSCLTLLGLSQLRLCLFVDHLFISRLFRMIFAILSPLFQANKSVSAYQHSLSQSLGAGQPCSHRAIRTTAAEPSGGSLEGAGRPEASLRDHVVSFVAVLNFIALSIKWETDLYITDIFSLNKQSPSLLLSFLLKYINHSREAVSAVVRPSSCMCHEVFCTRLGQPGSSTFFKW